MPDFGKHLSTGDRITAQAWNNIRDFCAQSAGEFTATAGLQPIVDRPRIIAYNNTGEALSPGDLIEVLWERYDNETVGDNQKTLFTGEREIPGDGLILQGVKPTGIPGSILGVAKGMAKAGDYVEVTVDGPVLASFDSITSEYRPYNGTFGFNGHDAVEDFQPDWGGASINLGAKCGILHNIHDYRHKAFLISTDDFNEYWPNGMKQGDVCFVKCNAAGIGNSRCYRTYEYVSEPDYTQPNGYDGRNLEPRIAVVAENLSIKWSEELNGADYYNRRFLIPFRFLDESPIMQTYYVTGTATYGEPAAQVGGHWVAAKVDNTNHRLEATSTVGKQHAIGYRTSRNGVVHIRWYDTPIVMQITCRYKPGLKAELANSDSNHIESAINQSSVPTLGNTNTNSSGLMAYDLYEGDLITVSVDWMPKDTDRADDFLVQFVNGPQDMKPGTTIWSSARPGRGWDEFFDVNPDHEAGWDNQMEYTINSGSASNQLSTASLGYKNDSVTGYGTSQTHCTDPDHGEETDKFGLQHTHNTWGSVWVKIASPDMEVNN